MNTNTATNEKLLTYSKYFIIIFTFVFFVLLFEYYTDSSVHLNPTQLYLQVKSIVNYDSEAMNTKPSYPNNIKPQPHIVMFVADDLGWNDISWHNPMIKSPFERRDYKTEQSTTMNWEAFLTNWDFDSCRTRYHHITSNPMSVINGSGGGGKNFLLKCSSLITVFSR